MVPTVAELAKRLMAPGKGILAADESARTMSKRLGSIDVEDSSENARRFRELMFTTPGIGQYLSGVIMYDSSIRNSTADGRPFPQVLENAGIMPGIKVDIGLAPLPGFPDEEISHGLDGLDVRLDEYYTFGARFTKWRSVVRITNDLPTDTALTANAHILSLYAATVQAHNMVPIVEPEVLFDGTHTLQRSSEVLHRTLDILFKTLVSYRVHLPGVVLKTSMALPGKESGVALDPVAIARETVTVLKDTVPAKVGGVVFLSGGQSPVQATDNLSHIAAHGAMPWPVTFSYSRALEEPVLEAWRGLDTNIPAAQQALQHRLALNVAAREGAYRTNME